MLPGKMETDTLLGDTVGNIGRLVMDIRNSRRNSEFIQQKKEMNDLELKTKKLELQKAELEGTTDPETIQLNRDIVKSQYKIRKEMFDGMERQLSVQRKQQEIEVQKQDAYQTGIAHGATTAVKDLMDMSGAQPQQLQSSGQVGLMTAPSKPAGVMSYGGQDYRINPFDGKIEEYKPDTKEKDSNIAVNETLQKERMKKLADAEEKLYAVNATFDSDISELDNILNKNKNTYSGGIGNITMSLKRKANLGKGDKTFENTAYVTNKMKTFVTQVLKSTFGGQLSDSEREYLNQVYGAADDMTIQERDVAIRNVKDIMGTAKKKLEGTVSGFSGNQPQSNMVGKYTRLQ